MDGLVVVAGGVESGLGGVLRRSLVGVENLKGVECLDVKNDLMGVVGGEEAVDVDVEDEERRLLLKTEGRVVLALLTEDESDAIRDDS